MTPPETRVRDELAAFRSRLHELAGHLEGDVLEDLLARIDDALSRFDRGDWGVCAVCHGTIDDARLASDPLVSICFDCLSELDRRELERDLASAARVQRALLPPAELVHADWEIAWLWRPRGAVSGDHLDLLPPQSADAPLHLLFGDVAGKGVAASLLQSHLHALFRALTAPDVPLADLLSRANRLFAQATGEASYATVVAARLHRDGRLELANAGHPRPLLADRRGVRPIEAAGVPLGLFAESRYAGQEVELAPDDVVLFYTDGWTEAERDEEEYGIGRAAAALRRAARRPLPDLLSACEDDVARFLDGRRLGDDLTLLAVRRLGETSAG